jgi:hypothetical protein
MTISRHVVLLGLWLIGSGSGAWAQSTEIFMGAILTLDGLTLKVDSCSLTTASATSCSSTDGIFLEGTSTGRGTVSYEVIGVSGGPVFSLASSATTNDSLSFTLTVATNQANSKIASGDLTLNGATSSSSTHHVTAAQSFAANSPSPAPKGLTSDSLFLATSATTQTTGAESFTNSPLLSSFQVTNTLFASAAPGTTVKLNSAVETFKTVSEPASLGVLMIGLASLAIARWQSRRRYRD